MTHCNSSTLVNVFWDIAWFSFICQIIVYTLISLIKHYLDTNLDTSEKSLDTFWILLGALSDTWPPLHVATEAVPVAPMWVYVGER